MCYTNICYTGMTICSITYVTVGSFGMIHDLPGGASWISLKRVSLPYAGIYVASRLTQSATPWEGRGDGSTTGWPATLLPMDPGLRIAHVPLVIRLERFRRKLSDSFVRSENGCFDKNMPKEAPVPPSGSFAGLVSTRFPVSGQLIALSSGTNFDGRSCGNSHARAIPKSSPPSQACPSKWTSWVLATSKAETASTASISSMPTAMPLLWKQSPQSIIRPSVKRFWANGSAWGYPDISRSTTSSPSGAPTATLEPLASWSGSVSMSAPKSSLSPRESRGATASLSDLTTPTTRASFAHSTFDHWPICVASSGRLNASTTSTIDTQSWVSERRGRFTLEHLAGLCRITWSSPGSEKHGRTDASPSRVSQTPVEAFASSLSGSLSTQRSFTSMSQAPLQRRTIGSASSIRADASKA
jgi:hypothetical protein